MTNYLRPDEMATKSEIRQAQSRNKDVRSVLEAASSFGTTALAAKGASKILPFLNQYIPEDLALKGISKLMPHIGNFLKSGTSQGLSLKSGLDFIKKEFSKEAQKKEIAKENRNIIEQESPELHQFLEQEIAKGRPPLHAGAIAQNDKRFSKVISGLSKKHKIDWSKIIEAVYGQEAKALPQNQQGLSPLAQEAMQPEGSQPIGPPSAEQQAQTQQQPPPGQGQQALMAVLQKINQKLGG